MVCCFSVIETSTVDFCLELYNIVKLTIPYHIGNEWVSVEKDRCSTKAEAIEPIISLLSITMLTEHMTSDIHFVAALWLQCLIIARDFREPLHNFFPIETRERVKRFWYSHCLALRLY